MATKQSSFNFVDDSFYPPSASASPSNAFYLRGCDVVQHRPAYCSCLAKIEARQHGGLDSMYAGCSTAIGHKTCPALSMRSEEELAGKAIYFVNRDKLRAFADEQAGQVTPSLSKVSESSLKPAPRPALKRPAESSIFPTMADGYAAAINAGIAELNKRTPAPASVPEQPKQVVSLPSMSPNPGESMVEFARRMAAQRAAA
ncbi:hypothetical protein N5B55_05330 [Ralstonia pickettii]|uniref:hypothetical protein n=1 Tax=Ralstonia pickettii TaxID=329 RepID=UPI002714A1DD|nr:hypothetical protein [Ralstonia pickettii]WKZ86378.1 hypothetical protein N5B55_05330 [Ralstonia pickettii]